MLRESFLVLGGGGFLGTHLISHLKELGYKNIASFDLYHRKKVSGVSYVEGDLTDKATLVEVFKGVDIIFHCASPSYAINNKKLFYKVNVEGTRVVIDAAREAKVKKIALVSSCSVVYNGKSLRNGDETTPFPQHMDYYTETKMVQEQIILQANGNGLMTVAIRPHGIFGENDHTISEMVKKAIEGKMGFIIGDGTNIVDFTYVKNVTHGLILAAQNIEAVNGQVFNITNDEPVHFWVFVSMVVTKLGYPSPAIHIPLSFLMIVSYVLVFVYGLFGKTPFLTPFKVALAGTHHYYNCEKVKKLLGYKPLVSLKDGLDRSIKSFECMNGTKTK